MSNNEKIMGQNLAVLLNVRQKAGIRSTGYAEKYRRDTQAAIEKIERHKNLLYGVRRVWLLVIISVITAKNPSPLPSSIRKADVRYASISIPSRVLQ